MHKNCFLFGHRNVPPGISALIKREIILIHTLHSVNNFIVGNHGSFDSAATEAVLEAKKIYPHIKLVFLTPYHPSQTRIYRKEIYDEIIYPPIENIPKKFSIVYANRYMIDNSSHIICYAGHSGNSYNFYTYASKKPNIIITNLY